MALHGKNLIGNDTSASGEATFRAINPATTEALEPAFTEATNLEINRALEKAEGAFRAYRQKSPAEIADFLDKIADEIVELGDELIERAVAETGLPAGRITGERGRTVGQLKMFAGVVREGSWVNARIDTALPDREPVPLWCLEPVIFRWLSPWPAAIRHRHWLPAARSLSKRTPHTPAPPSSSAMQSMQRRLRPTCRLARFPLSRGSPTGSASSW